MSGSIPDILKVVVLTPSSHALLRGYGPWIFPRLNTSKDVFELNHPSVCKHKRGVIQRHQRTGGYDFMAIDLKVLQKGLANIIYGFHGANVRAYGSLSRSPERQKSSLWIERPLSLLGNRWSGGTGSPGVVAVTRPIRLSHPTPKGYLQAFLQPRLQGCFQKHFHLFLLQHYHQDWLAYRH